MACRRRNGEPSALLMPDPRTASQARAFEDDDRKASPATRRLATRNATDLLIHMAASMPEWLSVTSALELAFQRLATAACVSTLGDQLTADFRLRTRDGRPPPIIGAAYSGRHAE